MIIKKQRERIDVFHNNGHLIGIFEYDLIWSKWILRTQSAGLDKYDLKKLYKIIKRLK